MTKDKLSTLIAQCLAEADEADKNAFLRQFGKAMEIELDPHSVREAKNNFSGLLDRVRRWEAVTIAPRRRAKDAVIVMSVPHLAKTLAAIATDFELSPTGSAHDPMVMFAAVDRMPKVGETEAKIARRPRRERSTLNLD